MRIFVLFFCLMLTSNIALALNKAEVATLEQKNSSICALNEIPSATRQDLIRATASYLQTKDSIAYTKSFDIDEVPASITKCFSVHATFTIDGKQNFNDFSHFYDLTERYLRFQLILKMMRESGVKSDDIKSFNENIQKKILQLNEEYYGTD